MGLAGGVSFFNLYFLAEKKVILQNLKEKKQDCAKWGIC